MKCLLFVLSFVGVSYASQGHYEGGTVTWRADPLHPQNINVTVQLNFKHSYTNGYLHEPCTDAAIQRREVLNTEGAFKLDGERVTWAKYVCSAYDEVDNWSMGTYTFAHTLRPGQTSLQINYEECCWLTDIANNGKQVSEGRGWNLASTVDISPRPDNNAINNPPMAAAIPVFKMNKGCQSALYIPAWDNDADIVKCRWTDPDRNECNNQDGDVCGPLYVDAKRRKIGAELEQDTCKLIFRSKNPKGIYAMSVMIEDFAPSDLTTPLSKIPLQFLVSVVPRNGKCRKPVMLDVHGACVTIPAGRPMQKSITARSSSPDFRIESIDTIKPLGITVSPVAKVEGSDTDYYVMLSWTPSIGQIGRHVICYKAEEEGRFYSDMACVYINVVDPDVYEPLHVLKSSSVPAEGSEITDRNFRIQFNKQVSRPDKAAFISILDAEDEVIFRADTSSETEVELQGNILMFSLPPDVILKYGSAYRIRVEAQAVRPTERCGSAPSVDEWNFTWMGRKLPGKLEGPDTVLEQPSSADCRSNFMQVFVSKELVGELDPSAMHLNDPTCTGREYNATHYVIGTSYNMCQTSVQAANEVGLVSFENTVYIPPQPYTPESEITRDHFIEIRMSCRLHSDNVGYVAFDPNVTTIVYYEEGFGKFDFSLDMYEDVYYATPIDRHAHPVPVQLDQPVFFEARINCDPEKHCDSDVMMIDSCWATPTTNPFDVTRFVFIKNGCAKDDTIQFLPSPSSNIKRFSVHSFAFLDEHIYNPVYVHCKMSKCNAQGVESSCDVNCEEPMESEESVDVIDGDTGNNLVRRSRRDVSDQSPQATEHIATRRLNPEGNLDANATAGFNADVVEIAMLGSVIVLLLMLICAQHMKQYAAGEKTTSSA
ncbi:uncharacterized protein LOC119742036 [Patiria miniata]|uniref:ZP domain-containing protein n=1 Tax=Patiria miniata TaxID=46514 RepID=A0A914BDA5_PATMI|nr:uncharacterized protein LOC119742036 [Patiria miniata]